MGWMFLLNSVEKWLNMICDKVVDQIAFYFFGILCEIPVGLV